MGKGSYGDGKANFGGYPSAGSRLVRICVTDDDSQQWNVEDRTDLSGERQIVAFDFWLGRSTQFVGLNDDDDDENGTIDFCDGETEEENGELEAVALYFSPGWVTVGKIKVSPTERLKVWADDEKSELIASYNSPKYFNPGDLNPAKTVWLEGVGSGGPTGLDMDYVWPDGEGWEVIDSKGYAFTVVDVDMDIEGVDDPDTGTGTKTEETTPGALIPLGDLVKIETMQLLPSELPVDASHRLYLKATAGGSKIKVWTSEQKTTEVTLPEVYESRGEIPSELWVEGYAVSDSARDITLTLEWEGYTDDIEMTVYELNYVRLWDEHKTSNRTTRAIDPALRDIREYEDNPRSDADETDDQPMLVLGGWCSSMSGADLELMCDFEPAGIGDYVRWEISGTHVDWVDGATEGSFDASDTVDIHLDLPSTGDWSSHTGDDIVIEVGLDCNADGVLQESEKFPGITWGCRVINEAEYDYCIGKYQWILVNLGWIVWPDACEFLDIFLDDNVVEDYSSAYSSTVVFDDDKYAQKNGLGCDEISLVEGELTLYYWDSETGLWERILEDDEFWDEAVEQCLADMNILNWYLAHPSENSHSFTESYSDELVFAQDNNLAHALHDCDVIVSCTAETVRGEGLFPQITSLSIEGSVTDLYDWDTDGSDDLHAWLSRIQTSYAPDCGRTAGNIFKVYVLLDATADLANPQDFDDYDNIRSEWLLSLGIW